MSDNPNAAMFPACWSCPFKVIQTDWVDPKRYNYIAGCKHLDHKKWDKGASKDSSGTVYQKNCPLKTNIRKVP